ncbi:MAG: hypothetical protein QM761_12485 [Pseudoxanthomonas sp.]
MKPNEIVLPLLLAAVLAACDAGTPASSTTAPPPATGPASPAPAAAAVSQAAATGEDALDGAAAEAVVRDYYAAIDARDFAAAYTKWSDGGTASGQDFAHFRDGYANTAAIEAEVGDAFDLEGAAGSRYVQVPVRLQARQRDGSLRRYEGRFTLRASVVDGASETQRHWRLHSAEMTRLPD